MYSIGYYRLVFKNLFLYIYLHTHLKQYIMKTNQNNADNKTIVCYHIGRGGRFYNPGHKTYLSYTEPSALVLDDSNHWFFINPENYQEILFELGNRPNLIAKWESCCRDSDYYFFENLGFVIGEDYYFDGGGKALVSVADVESGIFSVQHDYDYDTDYSCYIEDCDEHELELIVNADRDNVEEARQLLITNYDRLELLNVTEEEEL